MLDNTALTPGQCRCGGESLHHQWPGQALAYKIGELTIRRLTYPRGRGELGSEIRPATAFHDAVLLNGAVPMDVLEDQVDRWIAAQRAD